MKVLIVGFGCLVMASLAIAQTTEAPELETTPFPDEGYNCTEGGAFPHPLYCEYYYVCTDGIDSLLKCQRNYLFDLKYHGCNYPELTDCQDRERPVGYPGTTTPPTPTGLPTGTPPPSVCADGNGYYPNPLDCGGFYQCLDDIAYPYCCPFPLRYNIELHVCDFLMNVECGLRPDGDCVA